MDAHRVQSALRVFCPAESEREKGKESDRWMHTAVPDRHYCPKGVGRREGEHESEGEGQSDR